MRERGRERNTQKKYTDAKSRIFKVKICTNNETMPEHIKYSYH